MQTILLYIFFQMTSIKLVEVLDNKKQRKDSVNGFIFFFASIFCFVFGREEGHIIIRNDNIKEGAST
jgi:hypothetical protein